MSIKEIKSKELQEVWNGRKPDSINEEEYNTLRAKLLQLNACNGVEDIEFLNAIIESKDVKECRKKFILDINIPKLSLKIGFDFDEVESNIYDVELVQIGEGPIAE